MPERNLVTRFPLLTLLITTLVITGPSGCSKLRTAGLTSDLTPPSQSAFARPQELATEQAKAKSESARNYIGQKIDSTDRPEARIVGAFESDNSDQPMVKLQASTGPQPPAPSIASASLNPEEWVAGSQVVKQLNDPTAATIQQVGHQTDSTEAGTEESAKTADQGKVMVASAAEPMQATDKQDAAECEHDGECDCCRDPVPPSLDPVKTIQVADIADQEVSPTQTPAAKMTAQPTTATPAKLTAKTAGPAEITLNPTAPAIEINRLRAIPVESSSRQSAMLHPLRPLRAVTEQDSTTKTDSTSIPSSPTEVANSKPANQLQPAATISTPRVAAIDADLVNMIAADQQSTSEAIEPDHELTETKQAPEPRLSNIQVGELPKVHAIQPGAVQPTSTNKEASPSELPAPVETSDANQPASVTPAKIEDSQPTVTAEQSSNGAQGADVQSPGTEFSPSDTAVPADDLSPVGNDFAMDSAAAEDSAEATFNPIDSSDFDATPVDPQPLDEENDFPVAKAPSTDAAGSVPVSKVLDFVPEWPRAEQVEAPACETETESTPDVGADFDQLPYDAVPEELEFPTRPAAVEIDSTQIGKTSSEVNNSDADPVVNDFSPVQTQPQPVNQPAPQPTLQSNTENIFHPTDDRPESLPDLEQIEQAFAGLVSDQRLNAPKGSPADSVASPAEANVPDLATQLDRTIVQVKNELQSSSVGASRNGLEVNLRLLEMLKRQTANLDQQQRMINNDQKRSLQHQLDALAVMLVEGETQSINTNEQTLASLKAAVEELESLADLRVANGRLCTQISGFGNFKAFPESSFRGNQRMLVYCEVENQMSLPVNEVNGVVRFRTRLRGSLAIYDINGVIVQQQEFPVIDDRAHKRRRDFYVYFPIQLQNLSAGDYRMELMIEDIDGSKTATLKPAIEFSVYAN